MAMGSQQSRQGHGRLHQRRPMRGRGDPAQMRLQPDLVAGLVIRLSGCEEREDLAFVPRQDQRTRRSDLEDPARGAAQQAQKQADAEERAREQAEAKKHPILRALGLWKYKPSTCHANNSTPAAKPKQQ